MKNYQPEFAEESSVSFFLFFLPCSPPAPNCDLTRDGEQSLGGAEGKVQEQAVLLHSTLGLPNCFGATSLVKGAL